MSERINISDIQEAFRWYINESHLKNTKEKIAYQKYMDIYHKLSDAEHKKREWEHLCSITRSKHSQATVNMVKEILALEEEIQQLEADLERMEKSNLFKRIHCRILRGNNIKGTPKISTIIKWLKENFILVIVAAVVIALIIATNLP